MTLLQLIKITNKHILQEIKYSSKSIIKLSKYDVYFDKCFCTENNRLYFLIKSNRSHIMMFHFTIKNNYNTCSFVALNLKNKEEYLNYFEKIKLPSCVTYSLYYHLLIVKNEK